MPKVYSASDLVKLCIDGFNWIDAYVTDMDDNGVFVEVPNGGRHYASFEEVGLVW